jgi:hypothetical protein
MTIVVMCFISTIPHEPKPILQCWQGEVDLELPGYCAMGHLHHFQLVTYRIATAQEIKDYPFIASDKDVAEAFLRKCFDVGTMRSLLLCDRRNGSIHTKLIKHLGETVLGRKVVITPTHTNRNSGNEVFECILQQDASEE